MFTGIIETKAQIKQLKKMKDALRFTVLTRKALKGIRVGDSIAVNGVCLTVVKFRAKSISFDVIPQTLKLTNLSKLTTGQWVNIERSLKYGQRIDGHFVLGHIEATAKILKIKKGSKTDGHTFTIQLPTRLKKFAISQGSIAVDGISLTISKLSKTTFNVSLIPHTLKATTLGDKKVGSPVNIETDILMKTKL